MFTLLINLGGEGIGTIAFLEALEQQGTHVQVVLVGGMREQEKRELKELAGRCRAVRVHAAGFVDNIYEYLYACDIVVGKAGINAMLEAITCANFLVNTVTIPSRRRPIKSPRMASDGCA
jgi:UDP-N-acetylglucosamine:LPS N-acetylglucosamine transferase